MGLWAHGRQAAASRHRLSVLARRRGRGPGARPGPRPRARRPRPRRRRARPREPVHPGPGLRDARRPGRLDPLQRLGRPADVRARRDAPRASVAACRALRRAAPARAHRAEPVDAGAGLADGPIVATFHTVVDRSRTMAASGLLRPMLEKITAPDRGVAAGPAGAGRAPRRRRRRDSQRRGRRGLRRRRAAARVPAAPAARDRVRRPVRRAAQGHDVLLEALAARSAAPRTSGCSSSAAATGRPAAAARRRLADRVDVSWAP